MRVLELILGSQIPGDLIGNLVSNCCRLEVLDLACSYFEVLDISALNLTALTLGLSRCPELLISCRRLVNFFLAVSGVAKRNFQGDTPRMHNGGIKMNVEGSQSDVFLGPNP